MNKLAGAAAVSYQMGTPWKCGPQMTNDLYVEDRSFVCPADRPVFITKFNNDLIATPLLLLCLLLYLCPTNGLPPRNLLLLTEQQQESQGAAAVDVQIAVRELPPFRFGRPRSSSD